MDWAKLAAGGTGGGDDGGVGDGGGGGGGCPFDGGWWMLRCKNGPGCLRVLSCKYASQPLGAKGVNKMHRNPVGAWIDKV